MDEVCSISNIAQCLMGLGASSDLANFIALLVSVVAVAVVPLVSIIIIIYIERKIAARVQDRIGPNRVGPWGILQSVADAVKLLSKEDITPLGADKFIYNLAPIIAFAAVVLIWAVIPYTPQNVGVDLSIGILYFVAVGSIGTIKVMVAGWSSNNKYALLGAFRTIAQLLSYEVPLVLALLIPVMLSGTMSMQGVVWAQGGMWFVFMSPVAALIFYISNLAETGRAPFDLLEAESEIVAGYNIEYSGFKFGMFMAAEFLHAFTASVLAAVIFLGGWWGPGVEQFPALGFIYLGIKLALVYLFSLVLRSTVPRVRIDQLMSFNWKFLVPISIANVLVTALLMQIIRALGFALPADQADFAASLPATVILFLGNLVLIGVVVAMIRSYGRRMRQADEARLTAEGPHEGHSESQPFSLPAGD